ncbi:MAG TPA: hypothetical protein VMQ67_14035 [Candidatus Saccharimonadales bacterium]|nr:hypothetical protein [Candidatus Saccharimonadales bacterium]
MMEPRLRNELAGLERMLRRAQLWREMSVGWLAVTGIGVVFLLLRDFVGWQLSGEWIIPLASALIAIGIVWVRHAYRSTDLRPLVTMLEREHPELRHLLSAASEQEPDAASGGFRYLQLRAIEAVLEHPRRHEWREKLERRLSFARTVQVVTLAGMVMVLTHLGHNGGQPVLKAWLAPEITVTPGDTQVERGSSLVIAARFGRQPPPEATLVLESASGKTQRIAMERHLADPVFGASLSEVSEEGRYHIEYDGRKTGDFKVTVFDYPSLLRADALLHFPDYTGLTNKTIPDTRRISAIEGTRLTYTFQLNKPVRRATLVSTNHSFNLALKDNAIALLADFVLTNSGRYSLALEDADGRSNKFPADIVIQVLANKPPELRLVFPSGDQRVSRLEELQLQAEARGEFGLLKYGIGFGAAGEEPRIVELGQTAPANEKRQFNYLIALETLALEPDQVLTYFVWADDFGPDGKIRRTFSDMFFAEVRPFEEAFRAGQPGTSGGSGEGEGQQEGNAANELAEMQKEIVIATWKLRQEKPPPISTRSP